MKERLEKTGDHTDILPALVLQGNESHCLVDLLSEVGDHGVVARDPVEMPTMSMPLSFTIPQQTFTR